MWCGGRGGEGREGEFCPKKGHRKEVTKKAEGDGEEGAVSEGLHSRGRLGAVIITIINILRNDLVRGATITQNET